MAVQEEPCQVCGYKHEADTIIGRTPAMPKPGDVGVCLACGALAFYESSGLQGLRRRLATPAEIDQLRGDPKIRRVLATRAAQFGDRLRPDRQGH